MKSTSPTRSGVSSALLASLALAFSAATALAQATYHWDTDGDAANENYGGTGTWNTSLAHWNTANNGSGSLVAWTNPGSFTTNSGDNATFGGTGGTVTVGESVAVRLMTVGANSTYTFGGASRITFTRDSANGLLVQSGASATFSTVADFVGGMNIETQTGSQVSLAGLNLTGSTSRILTFTGGTNSVNHIGALTRGGTGFIQLRLGQSFSSNSATYHLNGNNTGLATDTNGVRIRRGTVVINHNSAFGTVSAAVVENANNTAGSGDTVRILTGTGGITMARAITFENLTANDTNDIREIGGQHTGGTSSYTGTITLGAFAASGSGSSLRVSSAAGGTTVFSGLITDGANTSAITKLGEGIVRFSRAAGNTYDGPTAVSEGVLLVTNTSGSGTGTGAVNVSAGATFGGNGSSSGPITLAAGARLSPGDMTEGGVSLAGTFTGATLTWNSDNTTGGLRFNLGEDALSSDLLVLSGAFSKGSGSSFLFDFTGSTINPSITYTLVTFGSTDFQIGDFAAINGGGGVFAFDGNSLVFSAIPEPSAWTTLAGAAGLFAAMGRRRRIAG